MQYGGYGGGGYEAGASQFAGGGFVPSPAGGAAAGHGGGGDKSRGVSQTIRDVTVRQLMRENVQGDDDQFKLDGVELTTFFILGRIVSRMESNTVLKLKVDDGTGVIEVMHYMEDTNELINMAAQEWTVNTYVRVCGSLRSMDGQRTCMAFRVKPVKDFNEITYHNMQCIFQHLHLTQAQNAPPGMQAQQGGMGGMGGMGGPRGGMAPGPMRAGGGADHPSKLHMDVLSVYNMAIGVDEGLAKEQVLATLNERGLHYTMQDVSAAIEMLANDGQLYTTLDDNHHRSTNLDH